MHAHTLWTQALSPDVREIPGAVWITAGGDPALVMARFADGGGTFLTFSPDGEVHHYFIS